MQKIWRISDEATYMGEPPVSFSILFSTGGWVLKRCMRPLADKGFMMNMWAVAASAFMGMRFEAEDIFCRARASP
jgi:hypothetical protein